MTERLEMKAPLPGPFLEHQGSGSRVRVPLSCEL